MENHEYVCKGCKHETKQGGCAFNSYSPSSRIPACLKCQNIDKSIGSKECRDCRGFGGKRCNFKAVEVR